MKFLAWMLVMNKNVDGHNWQTHSYKTKTIKFDMDKYWSDEFPNQPFTEELTVYIERRQHCNCCNNWRVLR